MYVKFHSQEDNVGCCKKEYTLAIQGLVICFSKNCEYFDMGRI